MEKWWTINSKTDNSDNFLSLLKSMGQKRPIWGYRHSRSGVLETSQNFSEFNAELLITSYECSPFYSEKFCKFSRTVFRKSLHPQLLNSSINLTELFYMCDISFYTEIDNYMLYVPSMISWRRNYFFLLQKKIYIHYYIRSK